MTITATGAPESQPEPTFAETLARYRREHSRLTRTLATVMRAASSLTGRRG